MYRVIIRTTPMGQINSSSLHRHLTPQFKPKIIQQTTQTNKIIGFIHFFRNTHLQSNIKTQLLLIIPFNQDDANWIILSLQTRKTQISIIDIVSEKKQGGNKVRSIIIVFKNSAISEQVLTYVKCKTKSIVVYLQDVVIMYGWNLNDQFNHEPTRIQVKAMNSILYQQVHQEHKINQLPKWIQLPICPKCLEKLQYSLTGLQPQNEFSERPEVKNENLTFCKVCTIFQQNKKQQTQCAQCKQTHDNWICLVCGAVGCGRYRNADAYKHFISSGHIVSMDLETQRVWNYRADCFSHRMTADENIGVKFPNYQQNVSEAALEGAFWDYCSLVSEQLHRQRIFYENTISATNEKNNQEQQKLDHIIDELKMVKHTKQENIKKQLKKKKKIQKKVHQMKQKCSEARQTNNDYQQTINSGQKSFQEDQQVILKKKEIQKLQNQIQELFTQLQKL